jgi:hypothetical protein
MRLPVKMKKKLSARDLEFSAVSAAPSYAPAPKAPVGEAMAMLVRRGLRPQPAVADLPFPNPPDEALAERLSGWLGHYAFRLFLRGAIQKSDSFLPSETTRYLTQEQSKSYAEVLAGLGLAERAPTKRYRLKWAAASFGGTLEWYVGRELKRRYGFDVVTGVKIHVRGAGGDLDVVAAAEGKLIYLELKSSPPRNLSASEAAGFFARLSLLHPDLSLFVIDTALRLSDKVLPMLVDAFRRSGCRDIRLNRIAAQMWALTPHIYVVNGRRDLMANIGKALAAGLRALSPDL